MDQNSLPSCFVIQQFDNGGTFDKRYYESIEPALKSANVDPKRADKILGLQPIIQKIETAISESSICIAEVSTDNSNVWLELGYALALDRPTVILCDKAIRNKLPFDIQHRPVIFYRSDSKSGYDELENKIVQEVQHELEKASKINSIPRLKIIGEESNELNDYEIELLGYLMALWGTSNIGSSHFEIEKHMKTIGYMGVAIGLGLTSLINKKLIFCIDEEVESNEGPYILHKYQLSADGINWLHTNKNLFNIKRKTKPKPIIAEDDLPF